MKFLVDNQLSPRVAQGPRTIESFEKHGEQGTEGMGERKPYSSDSHDQEWALPEPPVQVRTAGLHREYAQGAKYHLLRVQDGLSVEQSRRPQYALE